MHLVVSLLLDKWTKCHDAMKALRPQDAPAAPPPVDAGEPMKRLLQVVDWDALHAARRCAVVTQF